MTGAAVWTTVRALARTVGRPGLLHGDELQLRLQWILDRSPSASSYAPGGRLGQPLGLEDARSRLQRLVSAAGDDGADPCPDEAEIRRFPLFVGRCQEFLDDLGENHLRPPAQILAAG